MTDITELAQRMKTAAEKATPGEWVYFPKNTSIEYDVGSDESQGSILYVDSGDFTQAQTDRNGEFIALANPANILALVEALEKAQAKNALVAGGIEATAKLHERIAELESRTVKLPKLKMLEDYLAEVAIEERKQILVGVKLEFHRALTDAGIKVEAE
ncbi:TPA: ead/Ea22-like family protein [Klebsiella variicola subsp. variicola]